MVSNKVLLGRAGGVIRGSGFSKYRERHPYYYDLQYAYGAREAHHMNVLCDETRVCVY